jgi:hypothetical protein
LYNLGAAWVDGLAVEQDLGKADVFGYNFLINIKTDEADIFSYNILIKLVEMVLNKAGLANL